jgi:hypothetical protein
MRLCLLCMAWTYASDLEAAEFPSPVLNGLVRWAGLVVHLPLIFWRLIDALSYREEDCHIIPCDTLTP